MPGAGAGHSSVADDAAHRGDIAVALRLDLTAAHDAGVQFRHIARIAEEAELRVAGHRSRAASGFQGTQRIEQQTVRVGVRGGLRQQEVGQFHQVERLGQAGW